MVHFLDSCLGYMGWHPGGICWISKHHECLPAFLKNLGRPFVMLWIIIVVLVVLVQTPTYHWVVFRADSLCIGSFTLVACLWGLVQQFDVCVESSWHQSPFLYWLVGEFLCRLLIHSLVQHAHHCCELYHCYMFCLEHKASCIDRSMYLVIG